MSEIEKCEALCPECGDRSDQEVIKTIDHGGTSDPEQGGYWWCLLLKCGCGHEHEHSDSSA